MENLTECLAVRNLELWYGTFQSLRGISLGILHNRITAIIGPSGCGKSSLLRCFNRMNDLIPGSRVQGEVIFHGRNVYDAGVDPAEVRYRIGMVFQKPNQIGRAHV